MPLPDDVPLVISDDREYLNHRQLEDYKQHRKAALGWLYDIGKDPDIVEGFGLTVTRNTAYRLS